MMNRKLFEDLIKSIKEAGKIQRGEAKASRVTQMKQIPNFPNYVITNDGKVWSANYKKYLLPNNVQGYYQVALCKNGKVYTRYVHRLVLETFVGICPREMECCHNNGIRNDNRLENLRWGTRSDNVIDSVQHGTHPIAKLTKQDVMGIWKLWWGNMYTQTEIAKLYKVTRQNINYIINGKLWKHIWRN